MFKSLEFFVRIDAQLKPDKGHIVGRVSFGLSPALRDRNYSSGGSGLFMCVSLWRALMLYRIVELFCHFGVDPFEGFVLGHRRWLITNSVVSEGKVEVSLGEVWS